MPFPINAVHRLLLENGTSFLLLEDGTSKLVLDEPTALDDPLDGATVSTLTPTLTFSGEVIARPIVVQRPTGRDNNGVNGSISMPFDLANTAGNTIIVSIPVALTTNTGVTTPTDTNGNTYTQIADFTDGTHFVGQRWFRANNIKAGANTLSCNPDPGATNMHVWEVSNLDATSTFDKSASSITTSGTALSSGATATTTVANELVLGVFCVDAQDTYTVGAGFSNGVTVPNTAFSSFGEEMVVTTAGAQTATATVSTSTTALSVVMTFKAAIPQLIYEVEVDTANTFDSVSGAPLLDNTSDLSIGFIDDTTGETADPLLLLEDGTSHLLLEDGVSRLVLNETYTPGDYVSYTVPAATLSNSTTYYWQARQKPTNGSYGSWSGTQSFAVSSGTSIAVTQVAATVTASGGTQSIATVNNVAISQSAGTVTATGGTQVITAVVIASGSVAQVGATVTVSGGTQTIASVQNSAISQVAGSVTVSGGTQVVNAVIIASASITQVAASVTAMGGTQSLATVNDVSIAQLAGSVTATGGTQVITTVNNANVTQVAGVVTASGGTQTLAGVNDVSITQVAGTVTATGGTQVIATIQNVAVTQVAATVTATGGMQVVATMQNSSVTQAAGTVTVNGGTQLVGISGITSSLANFVMLTDGTPALIIASNQRQIVNLLDGNKALHIGNKLYMQL